MGMESAMKRTEKVLITGFGFIGRHAADALIEAGYTVAALDRCPDVSNMSALGVAPIIGDVRDPALLDHIIPCFDAVVNTAGLLGTSEMIEDPIPAVQTNIIGAINVFQACKKEKRRGRSIRCVHITVGNHFMDNSYSITKSSSERFAAMFNVEHQTDIRVVRALNAYGEYQKYYPVRKIIPNFVRAALSNEPVRVYGDGEQVMDMIYVKDVAKILVATLAVESCALIVSAGTGRRLTVNEIAEKVVAACGSSSTIEHVPMRAGEPKNSVVLGDTTTLSAIGFNERCLTRFEDGILPTVRWYSANRSILDL
jgi:nucleoside-diphosphate-sugar epimerase